MPQPSTSFSAWNAERLKKANADQAPDAQANMPPGMSASTSKDVAKTLAANPKPAAVPASASQPTSEQPGIQTAGSDQSPFDGSKRQIAQDTGAVGDGGVRSLAGGTMMVVPTKETETEAKSGPTKTSGSKQEEVAPISDAGYQTAQKRSLGTPGIQAMMADQANLRAASDPYFKGAAAGGASLDLTPLMSLGDALYGTKTAQNYVSPMAKIQALAGITKTLGEGNKALSDADVAMLGANLRNTAETTGGSTTNPIVTKNTNKELPESMIGALNFNKSIENTASADAGKEVKEQETDMAMDASLRGLQPILARYSGDDGPQFVIQKAIANLSPLAAKFVPKNLPTTSPKVINALEQVGSITHEQAQDARDYALYMGQIVNGMNSKEFKSRQTDTEQGITNRLTGNVAGANMATVRTALGTATRFLQRTTAARANTLTPEGQAKLAANPYALKAEGINYDFTDPAAKRAAAAIAAGGPGIVPQPQPQAAPPRAPPRAPPAAAPGTATAAPPQAQPPRPQRSKSTGIVRWMQVGPDGVDREVPAPNGR